MLSLVELERVATAIGTTLVGGRVERWVEPDKGRLAFQIYRRAEDERTKCVVDLDARPELAHVGVLDRMPKAPDQLPAFSAYLRAHLSRARLEGATLRGDDRQLALRFSAEEGEFVLLLSIFGRRSNLYLLDAEDRLVLALRPLAETRGELAPGAPWVDPGTAAPRRGDDRFPALEGLALLEAISSGADTILINQPAGLALAILKAAEDELAEFRTDDGRMEFDSPAHILVGRRTG